MQAGGTSTSMTCLHRNVTGILPDAHRWQQLLQRREAEVAEMQRQLSLAEQVVASAAADWEAQLQAQLQRCQQLQDQAKQHESALQVAAQVGLGGMNVGARLSWLGRGPGKGVLPTLQVTAHVGA